MTDGPRGSSDGAGALHHPYSYVELRAFIPFRRYHAALLP